MVKPIEAIGVGALVWALGAHGVRVKRPVTRLFRHEARPVLELVIATEDNYTEIIEATTEHPFWVLGRGWLAASELRAGDLLKRIDACGKARVLSTTRRGRCAADFNIEVDGIHNYFVSRRGVLVHNQAHVDGGAGLTPAALDGEWAHHRCAYLSLQRLQRMGGTIELLAADPSGSSDLAFIDVAAESRQPVAKVRLVSDAIVADARKDGVAPAVRAAAVAAHEIDHLRFSRTRLGRALADTQYEEYRALTKEFLVAKGRRPDLAEKKTLWAITGATYGDLEVGRYPFGRQEVSFAEVGSHVRSPSLPGDWRAIERLPAIDRLVLSWLKVVETAATLPFERSQLHFARGPQGPSEFVDHVEVRGVDAEPVTLGQNYGEHSEDRSYISLSLENRQCVGSAMTKLKPKGFGLTDAVLRHGIDAYRARFGVPPRATEGSITQQNMQIFAHEYLVAGMMLPDATADLLAQIAIRKTPFGSARVKAGYGDFSFPWGLQLSTVQDTRGSFHTIPQPGSIRAAVSPAHEPPSLADIDNGW